MKMMENELMNQKTLLEVDCEQNSGAAEDAGASIWPE